MSDDQDTPNKINEIKDMSDNAEIKEILNDKEIEVFLSGPLTAAVFKPTQQKQGTSLTALLMPLRIKE